MHSTMMHYNRPWPQYQQMLIEQHPYYQMATHDVHLQYSMNEHQEEDYEQSRDELPSETSDDQNQNADMFRLAFAASQWSKLVLNAEGLFNKLMSTNAIPDNEENLLKNQIEQWLCMKQEYEECIARDESDSLHGYTENTRRSLERIEEVTETTETDEKTDESNNRTHNQLQVRSKSCSSNSLNTSCRSETLDSTTDVTDDSDQSDDDSENSDFIDKLEDGMKKFAIETDDVVHLAVNNVLKSNDDFSQSYCSKSSSSIPENDAHSQNNSPEPNLVGRNSFTTTAKSTPIRKQSARRTSILPYSEMSDELAEFQKQNYHSNNINLQQNNNYDLIPLVNFGSHKKTETQVESYQSCAETSLGVNMKSSGNVKVDSSIGIDCEHLNTLKTLRTEIIEKQSEVKKIQCNTDILKTQIKELQSAILEKKNLIEELKQNLPARKIAKQKYGELQRKYEEKYLEYRKQYRQLQRNSPHNQDMEKYKHLTTKYDKKRRDLANIGQIFHNSIKTLEYSEKNVNKLMSKLEILQLQLKTEEKRREELDNETIDCQKKVKQLEEVYNLTPANLKKILSASEDGKNYRIKVKSDVNECSTEINIKSVFMNDSTKAKSNCKNIDDMDEKESVRKEIRDLRHIRDLLIKMQCEKSSAKMTPTTKIERQVLHLSEFIECIDAMIEEKNVMICSKADLNQNRSNKVDEHTSVFNRLEKLSHRELITLFYKYFYKVIDLKESSQNLEIHNTVLEGKIESLKLNHDKKITESQRKYEQEKTLLLNYYPDDSSSSVCDGKMDRIRAVERWCRSLLKENQDLKQRLSHFESLFKPCKTESTQAMQPHSPRIDRPTIKHLGHNQQSEHEVFRIKNKIVLQKCDKKK